MTQLKKIAIAIEVLVDFDEAQNLLKDRWYGDTDREDIPYERWSRTFFAQLPPRKGTMGFINDLRDEGGQCIFFTRSEDPVQGQRAEQWLREWTADAFLILSQTASPVILDAQVFFVPDDDVYHFPQDRQRVVRVPFSGTFVPGDYKWALDSESDGVEPKPKPKVKAKS